jgi:hypothetical protein
MYNNKHHKFEVQYNHKLFAHINRWGNDVTEYIAQLKPKIIKFLDPNLANVQAVRAIVPDGLLVYRKWQPAQPLGNSEVEAFQLGIEFGQEIAAEESVRKGLVDLVEGYNERLGETAPAAEHRKFAKFQMGFQEGLGLAPVEPVAFNFGTGNMNDGLIMEHYAEVLDSYKWLGFHEYDWPRMDRLHLQGWAEGNKGMWLALRYRRIMEPIIAKIGENRWSVIVTECGMTQGVLGGRDVGFLHPTNTTQGEWSNHPTPISNDDYWETLNWYSDELMKDDYVAGACMFVTGALSPWESFETISTITPKLVEFQKTVDNGGSMSDIFVNDVRANDDASLDLVPRIETFEDLQQRFGLDVDRTHGESRAQPGQRFWRLVGFEVRTGVAAFLTQVKDINGNPAKDILVFNHWPGADGLPDGVDPKYFPNATGGFTDSSGVQGAPYSGGAVTGPNGGPYHIWLSSDPPGGKRIGSDSASRLGWIGGTDHLTANPIFQDVLKSGSPPPDNGDAKLVVFDASGDFVGEVALTSGKGAGGRIALFSGNVERSHVELE